VHLAFAASLSMSLLALPPPPDKIQRQTVCFGTVTIDHRAHLKRRSPCQSCHGDGMIGKLALGPKIAHDRCRGCHVAEGRGPIECRGCHTLSELPSTAQAVRAPPPVQEEGYDLTTIDALRARYPQRDEAATDVVYAPPEMNASR
jgi:hypothetical protein